MKNDYSNYLVKFETNLKMYIYNYSRKYSNICVYVQYAHVLYKTFKNKTLTLQ